MMITTLMENLVYQKRLTAEHGLALHVEVDGQQILFDTGQTEGLIQNAGELGIDPGNIDHCIISHGHYDHTGGLGEVMSMNPRMKLWIHPQASLPRYNRHGEYIGMASPELTKASSRTEGVTRISETVYILPAASITYPEDLNMEGFTMDIDGKRVPDKFSDEQSLVLVRNGRLQILSGCSHRGITNIIQSAVDHFHLPVDLVVGGFHLRHSQDLDAIARILNGFKIRRIGVSHCTGVRQYTQLQTLVNAEVFYNHTGSIITI
ncbi:MBL fold metallo-hydrolase [Salinispira pacifica]|uniref:7,8 dihydropteroate synthase (Methanopterin) n=1 Tax=Salinispira pacifica TaxID=1307761 RepID=V5WID2_9SPIO|nr:MBL fold metallo-hydrolase [Salinispira pacifica]AHC15390.1 7,8 dihydropteroate synthase (methanopterin) [Salinispira pacifica]